MKRTWQCWVLFLCLFYHFKQGKWKWNRKSNSVARNINSLEIPVSNVIVWATTTSAIKGTWKQSMKVLSLDYQTKKDISALGCIKKLEPWQTEFLDYLYIHLQQGFSKWFSLSSVSDSCSWLDSSWLTKNHGRGRMPWSPLSFSSRGNWNGQVEHLPDVWEHRQGYGPPICWWEWSSWRIQGRS